MTFIEVWSNSSMVGKLDYEPKSRVRSPVGLGICVKNTNVCSRLCV